MLSDQLLSFVMNISGNGEVSQKRFFFMRYVAQFRISASNNLLYLNSHDTEFSF